MVAVDYNEKNTGSSVKFLCSYGGRIRPRSTDGKLRYVGGLTRVLSVDRSISFEELMKKLCEFCGYTVDLRCQLPNGDLETLISVKSEEDLTSIFEEYDRVSGAIKIRAVLSTPRSQKHESPSSSSGDRSPKSPFSVTPSPPNSPSPAYGRYLQSRIREGHEIIHTEFLCLFDPSFIPT
ncbi:Protein PAL OF QUIRKY [Cardamine amara subsp. amara]|uniref:Protein PAL OF QUIRKY n=1 Tax=Cardamine amara subsp. amara TaxID=228776 RepID=A0ABD1AKY8_CARAN